MKKVLLVCSGGLGRGGVQTVIMNLVRQLYNQYTFDIVVFTNEKRYYENEFSKYGGKIFRIPYYEGKNSYIRRIDYYIRGVRIKKAITSIIRTYGPYDIIHCNNDFESGICLKAAWKTLVPTRIAHTHIIYKKANLIEQLLDKSRVNKIKKYSTSIIACSKESAVSFFGSDQNVTVVNNPYNEQSFFFSPLEKSNSLIISQVGSFSDNKNQKFSLEIIKELKKSIPSVELNLVGFGYCDYIRELKQITKEYSIEENVHFYPSDYDIPSLLRRSNAFLFPSFREGFGIVLIEAQAVGVKCYVSDTVPEETNLGGCVYLKLEEGAAAWSTRILRDYLQGYCIHNYYDCQAFSSNTFAGKVAYIYERNQTVNE